MRQGSSRDTLSNGLDMLRVGLIFLLLLFFDGCAIRHYAVSHADVVIIKSPYLRYADEGYIRHSGDAILLQMYEAGTLVKTIKVNHLICVDKEGCLTKQMFNDRYLNSNYPSGILQHIILGKKIYNGKNYVKVPGGFTQRIANLHVNISYSVISHVITFQDLRNDIFIKISPLQL